MREACSNSSGCGTAYTTTSAAANVTIRPDCLSNPNLSDPSISRWFNSASFGASAPGRYGTCGTGVIIGPTLNVWHAGIFKTITFEERLRVRAELTATNILNHPNYNDPTLNISQGGQRRCDQRCGRFLERFRGVNPARSELYRDRG
ncbi:MAG: hypothetical protein HRJ53_09715 [Acidobacteria bacterium Pan2503]|uniref:TonB-dependent transporter Oar-like beta-barrel domain-containing protein n=1 Tax=Candidatus Acidiferrum panamense TaxID=2741543 RepID=A0A7V8NPU6_9BACT|nr:hypothetical protein [Candidatus Acidoferrum panamensis]